MRVLSSRSELTPFLKSLSPSEGLGLVPTMGYFHAGHRALMRAAKRDGPTLVSLFVNPKQFGVGEDLARYPRDLEGDMAAAEEEGVDVVYAPPVDDIFPEGFRTEVRVAGLSDLYCGYFRPGHFAGVTTVLARLFGIVRPERAYFGQKDYQQTVIVKRMVEDLALPIGIRVVPTVREADGLAMSSRNVYLSPEERRQAPMIHKTLLEADALFRAGEVEASRLLGRTSAALSRIPGFRIQYLVLVDPTTLDERRTAREGDVLLTAGFFGSTRLIDNQILGTSP